MRALALGALDSGAAFLVFRTQRVPPIVRLSHQSGTRFASSLMATINCFRSHSSVNPVRGPQAAFSGPAPLHLPCDPAASACESGPVEADDRPRPLPSCQTARRSAVDSRRRSTDREPSSPPIAARTAPNSSPANVHHRPVVAVFACC